jgi:hypothetical protein
MRFLVKEVCFCLVFMWLVLEIGGGGVGMLRL